MNRRMPNGTYGGVRGWGRKAPAYSILGGIPARETCQARSYPPRLSTLPYQAPLYFLIR